MKSIKKHLVKYQTELFRVYWAFAAERQRIFFRRYQNQIPPWTSDPILSKYKFTNVYRASDRVSQYLIRNVIYGKKYDNEDLFFRVLLFKIFNKIQTWEILESKVGEIIFDRVLINEIDRLMTELMKKKIPVFSGAYIMPSGAKIFPAKRKHSNYLSLIKQMMDDEVFLRVQESKSLENLYLLLLSYPMVGPFLAYQYSVDLNYSELVNFSESSFVVAGPGAVDGIHKCFTDLGKYSPEEIITGVFEHQDFFINEFEIDFIDLWGRRPQLIDLQNVFCEISKYSRMSHPHIVGKNGRTRIKQLYQPHELETLELFYPPKWRLLKK